MKPFWSCYTFPTFGLFSVPGENGKIVYSITSGDDHGDFEIFSNGTISTKKQLDRETQAIYNLVVTATDKALPPEKPLSSTVQVSSNDINFEKCFSLYPTLQITDKIIEANEYRILYIIVLSQLIFWESSNKYSTIIKWWMNQLFYYKKRIKQEYFSQMFVLDFEILALENATNY